MDHMVFLAAVIFSVAFLLGMLVPLLVGRADIAQARLLRGAAAADNITAARHLQDAQELLAQLRAINGPEAVGLSGLGGPGPFQPAFTGPNGRDAQGQTPAQVQAFRDAVDKHGAWASFHAAWAPLDWDGQGEPKVFAVNIDYRSPRTRPGAAGVLWLVAQLRVIVAQVETALQDRVVAHKTHLEGVLWPMPPPPKPPEAA